MTGSVNGKADRRAKCHADGEPEWCLQRAYEEGRKDRDGRRAWVRWVVERRCVTVRRCSSRRVSSPWNSSRPGPAGRSNQAEVCVPLGGGRFDARAVSERLGMAVVDEPAAGLWAIGPATLGERALTTAVAPELVLDGLDGTPFRLSSLHGNKVVIVGWAPY
jgi:hypothetical protein